jgi:hypothetical protein
MLPLISFETGTSATVPGDPLEYIRSNNRGC